MVKNLNTIEKSERIRIGKHVPDEQALNTIIINASSNVIEASDEGLYVAPIRTNTGLTSNALCYDVTTKEIVDSGAPIAPQDLQGVTENGNTTTETVEFNNATTGFVTASNVGIANTNPMHELSVGGDAYITGNLIVLGETTLISSENLRVKDAIVELGENNTDSDFRFDLGIVMTRPESNVTAAFIESSNEYVIGYTYSSASDRYINVDTSNSIEMRVYGNLTADNITGDGSNISNVVKYSDLSANVILIQQDIQSNVDILRDEMEANTLALRSDLQSNVDTLRDEMAANTITLRSDLQSNVDILRDEMESNTLTLRSEMTANTVSMRSELQSNLSTIRGEMESNTLTLRSEMAANTLSTRSELQSNLVIIRDEMEANTLTLRSEMAANTLSMRSELQSNLTIIRGEMAANTITIRGEMAANTLSMRSELQSNLSIIRSEMAANTISMREEMQSNLALKANVDNPVFTGLITGDGGAISNISLQHVTEYGNATDRTISISNALSLITSGSVGINTPTPQKTLHVAGEILADDNITGVDFYGDDATFTGGLTVSGDTLIYGDLEVRGNTTYLSTQNLLIEDPILALGANNTSSSLDTGLIVLVYQGSSNVAFGYRGASNEFIIGHTLSSPDDSELTPDTSNAINVHVYGDITADTFIGDGGFLSNIASNLQQISLNGNVTTETMYLENVTTGLEVDSNVIVGGNVTATTFIGDGSNLTNVVKYSELESNLSVIRGEMASNTLELRTDLQSNVSILRGEISRANTITFSNVTTGLIVDANVVVGGNVTATTFIGDGGFLSNIASNLEQIALNGNVTTQTLYLNNATTAFTTDLTSNVGVKLDQLSNVIITSPQTDHLLTYDGANWVNDFNIHNFIKVHNNTGDTLHKGNAIYIVDSFNNNVANVALAKSDSSSTMPAIGLIHEDVAPGEEGVAVAYGKVTGINTLGYTEGQTVYVSNTSAGNIMNSKPYGLGDQIQNVGVCIRAHENNGVVFVTGVGRSNDIPNAPISSSPNYVYVNETNNDMKKIAPENLLTKLQTLEQVVNTGNTVSNTINLTGLNTSGNIAIGSNVSIAGLADPVNKYLPMVDNDGTLIHSPVFVNENGTYVITAAEAEFLGNITLGGNTTLISSTSVIIGDRIFGVGANNSSTNLDSGFMIEHKDGDTYANVGLIYHAVDHKFTIGYTQNTFTDDHILDFTDENHRMLVEIDGNLLVQNNITVNSGSYFGDGTTLTGVALEADLDSNVTKITNLQTDLDSNVIKITNLQTDLESNSTRIDNIITDLDSNVTKITNLQTDLDSNATRITALESGDITISGLKIFSSNFQVGEIANLYVDTATSNVGIGTSTPAYELDVSGNINFIGNLYNNGSIFTSGGDTTEIENNLSDNSLRITAVSDNLAANVTRIDNIVTDLDSNVTKITNLQTDLDSNVTRIIALESGDMTISGLKTFSSDFEVGTANLFVDTTNGHVGIRTNTPSAPLHVQGGTIINSDTVAKKTYAFSGDLTNGQTIANSTIKITFSNHVFYAKIVAHLIESDDEVSTISFECGGGNWSGTLPSNDVSIGSIGIFGGTSTNPWNSSLTSTATTVSFAPTTNMAADGHYNVFIEYVSQNSSGVVSKITEGSTDVVTFTY